MLVLARLAINDQPFVVAVDMEKPVALQIVQQTFFFHENLLLESVTRTYFIQKIVIPAPKVKNANGSTSYGDQNRHRGIHPNKILKLTTEGYGVAYEGKRRLSTFRYHMREGQKDLDQRKVTPLPAFPSRKKPVSHAYSIYNWDFQKKPLVTAIAAV